MRWRQGLRRISSYFLAALAGVGAAVAVAAAAAGAAVVVELYRLTSRRTAASLRRRLEREGVPGELARSLARRYAELRRPPGLADFVRMSAGLSRLTLPLGLGGTGRRPTSGPWQPPPDRPASRRRVCRTCSA